MTSTEADNLIATLPKPGGLQLFREGDRIVMEGGKWGPHSLSVPVSSGERLLVHWKGYVENQGLALGPGYSMEKPSPALIPHLRSAERDYAPGDKIAFSSPSYAGKGHHGWRPGVVVRDTQACARRVFVQVRHRGRAQDRRAAAAASDLEETCRGAEALMSKKLERDLVEHARHQLGEAARRHVRSGMGPESAARVAIRETLVLFPFGWKLGVQGDDSDEFVEVWEVEHKYGAPIVRVSREPTSVKKRASKKRSHATRQTPQFPAGRWNHRSVAQSLAVPEDVVRRIYAAIQTAKKQGLYGGHTVDLIERSLGRRLMGNEYTVSTWAHEHLQHKPPSGYEGPKPRGSAREPPRTRPDDPDITEASRLAARANRIIHDVRRRKDPWTNWSTKDRELLHEAADELDVAADLYEKAGSNIRAGSLHERAKHARDGDDAKLAAYESV